MKSITYRHIEDIFVTALEGGSNYWYFLDDMAVNKIKHETPELQGEPLSIRMARAVWTAGVAIPVRDYETNDLLGEVKRNSMTAAIKAYKQSRGYFDIDQIDASEADWIFQYAVMGEIVFS
jgi:hypothetical protein